MDPECLQFEDLAVTLPERKVLVLDPRVQVPRTKEIYLSQRDKGLPLDREVTDITNRQVAVYEGRRGNPMLG